MRSSGLRWHHGSMLVALLPPTLCHPPWVHQCQAFQAAHGDPAALGHQESRVHRGIHVHPMVGGDDQREAPQGHSEGDNGIVLRTEGSASVPGGTGVNWEERGHRATGTVRVRWLWWSCLDSAPHLSPPNILWDRRIPVPEQGDEQYSLWDQQDRGHQLLREHPAERRGEPGVSTGGSQCWGGGQRGLSPPCSPGMNGLTWSPGLPLSPGGPGGPGSPCLGTRRGVRGGCPPASPQFPPVCPHSPGIQKDRGLLALLSHPQDPKGRKDSSDGSEAPPSPFLDSPLCSPSPTPRFWTKSKITPGWSSWDTKSPHFNTGGFAPPVSPTCLAMIFHPDLGATPPQPHISNIRPQKEKQ